MRKTKVHFFTIADYEEEEIWLREQHRAGWRLVKVVPPCFYVFESCVPQDVIYRLDYKNDRQTEEYMQMLGDFGWEYFAKSIGWLYFRKPADMAESAEDGELFCDNASRVEMITRIVRTRLLPLLGIFLCCVIPNYIMASTREGSGGVWTFFTVFYAVMFIIYMFLIVYCGAKLRKLREKYR